jgi:hypothetical protein
MTVDLRQELAELAEGARSYADVDAALDRARRIRRRRRLTPAVAAVALAAVAAVVWTVVPMPADAPPSSSTLYPELPRLVEPPAEPPQLLPTDRAVGEAALAYQCRGCPAYLVMPDGTHYRLDDYADSDGSRAVALSPDGRWLGLATAEGFLLRDLTSTAYQTYGDFYSIAWSPNSRWLVGSYRGGSGYRVVDTATGELNGVDGARELHGMVPQVLDSGELVVLDEESLALRFLDPNTGDVREIGTEVQSYDGAAPSALFVSADVALAMFIRIDGDTFEPAGAQLISLADGELVGRVDAPATASFWYADRVDGERLRIVQLTDPGGAWEVSAHELDSGTTELASRLAINGSFVLRGDASWFSDLNETGT